MSNDPIQQPTNLSLADYLGDLAAPALREKATSQNTETLFTEHAKSATEKAKNALMVVLNDGNHTLGDVEEALTEAGALLFGDLESMRVPEEKRHDMVVYKAREILTASNETGLMPTLVGQAFEEARYMEVPKENVIEHCKAVAIIHASVPLEDQPDIEDIGVVLANLQSVYRIEDGDLLDDLYEQYKNIGEMELMFEGIEAVTGSGRRMELFLEVLFLENKRRSADGQQLVPLTDLCQM